MPFYGRFKNGLMDLNVYNIFRRNCKYVIFKHFFFSNFNKGIKTSKYEVSFSSSGSGNSSRSSSSDISNVSIIIRSSSSSVGERVGINIRVNICRDTRILAFGVLGIKSLGFILTPFVNLPVLQGLNLGCRPCTLKLPKGVKYVHLNNWLFFS